MGVPTFYINGIECAHRFPGGRLGIAESSAEDGPRVTIPLKVAWEDRWDLVQALRGTCFLGPDGVSAVRTAPYSLPDNPNLVCVATGQFEYIGAGADGDTGDPFSSYAVVPAMFACVPWQFQDGDPAGQNDASGQAWTVTKIKPSAEVYQPIGGTYYIGPFPSTTPLDEASVGLLRANTEIQVTRKFLPRMPLDMIESALGCVNSATMTFADNAYSLDKLLLIAVESSDPYFDCVGNPVMDVNYTYLARANSWNAVQDRTASWNLLNTKADGTGTEPFLPFDFTSLPR